MKKSKNIDLYRRVEKVLDTLRPFLQRDQGDVELVSVSDEKTVQVALKGNCTSCPVSAMTLENGITASIKSAIPEIQHVESVTNNTEK